jgi:hypothetical protein
MIFRILILVALIKLVVHDTNPFVCTGIYAALGFVTRIFSGAALPALVLSTLLSFALASVYFYLLYRLEEKGVWWWAVLIGGLAIGLV